MSKVLTCLTISCAIFICVFGVPAPEENSSETVSDVYAQRVKLLTGSSTPPTCQQNQSDLNECLKRMFKIIQPRVAAGIPELNIPPSEPLRLNSTVFRFNLGVASGRFQMKNAAIHGISSHEIRKVDFKVENGVTKFKSEAFVPKLRIIGNYKASITLSNQFNLKPHGTFNLTLYNVTIKMSSEGRLYERDGHKFVQLNKIDGVPKIGHMDIDVTGVFEDPELNEFANDIAKQYWRQVYERMLPETRDYWEPLILRLMNETLSVLPYDAFVKNL